MRYFFLLIPFLFISTFTYASTRTFKPIGELDFFKQSTSITQQTGLKYTGGGTSNGKYVGIKIDPKSLKGLGRSLAKKHPVTLTALLAANYFLGEDEQLMGPPKESGVMPSNDSGMETFSRIDCRVNLGEVTAPGDVTTVSGLSSVCKATQWKKVLNSDPKNCGSMSWETDTKVLYNYNPYGNCSAGHPATVRSSRNFSTPYNLEVYTIKVCPTDQNPDRTEGIDQDGDGQPDICATPQDIEDYSPSESTLEEFAPEYADEFQKWFNESITSLQQWEPLVDPDTGNIETGFIESYNEPNVSPTFNEYLKSVASGEYQTTDDTQPNYVPQDKVSPTRVAITSINNRQPFIDPTTDTVVDPNITTNGVSPSSSTPTGSQADPLNVTGNITVNVEVPEDDTISQTEYEQSNNKFFEQFGSTAQQYNEAVGNQTDTLKANEDSFIESLATDITNFTVPDFPTLQSFFPTLPFGSCVGFTITTSVGGVQRPMVIDTYCPPYNTYFHPLLAWALSIFTALYIFHLASRTIEDS